MKSFNGFTALFALLVSCLLRPLNGVSVTPQEAKQLRDEVRQMFYHAFDGYMEHAFPLDELRPLSCMGEDSLGGYALTLIDSLDTLALFGDKERFSAAVNWLGKNVQFNKEPSYDNMVEPSPQAPAFTCCSVQPESYATGNVIEDVQNVTFFHPKTCEPVLNRLNDTVEGAASQGLLFGKVFQHSRQYFGVQGALLVSCFAMMSGIFPGSLENLL